jgi:hypothetical protein
MSEGSDTPRRVRVERNIYRRPTGVLEVGFKDASGIQRWRTVDGGVMAARKLRDDLLAHRGRGETVAPNSRLRLGEAADLWLAGPVIDLRPATQAGYRSAVDRHLRPRYGQRRLESLTADELAELVRDMRQDGKSEATIAAVLGAVGRIYKFAARRLGFTGVNPITLMLSSERPKVSLATRRPIFTPEQIEQTLAASAEPYRTLFTVAALTGRGSRSSVAWLGPTSRSMTSTMRRSHSGSRSIGTAIAGRRRPMARPAPCRSRGSSRW